MQRADSLKKQAEAILYSNPKQALDLAYQAIQLCPDKKPNSQRAEIVMLYCHAEQLLGNFDLSIQHLYDV